MDNTKNEKDIITNAIFALKSDVNKSMLSDSEKIALIKLLDSLLVYYENKKVLIINKGSDSCNESLAILCSLITDIIVKINSVLTGEIDVHYFVNLMPNELHEKDLKKILDYK